MNLALRFDQALDTKFKKVETSDLVFYGALAICAHLTLLIVNRFLIFNVVKASISEQMRPFYSFDFYLFTFTAILAELTFFVLGWLFVIGMANLLDGQSNARALFGGLALCYVPVVMSSVATFVVYFSQADKVNTVALAQAQTGEQLWAAIDASFSGPAFAAAIRGEKIAYGALLLLAVEAVSRICNLGRLKALVCMGLFVGVLFMINYFAG